ncbi:MAG: hypothetical protein ACXWJ8_06410 [Xanthobacteraceae bacterium]
MSKMKRPNLQNSWRCAVAMAVVLGLWAIRPALAQDQTPPPQGVSRGENFSAKPPAALFASDCTGSGCHKSPQGLGKSVGIGGLAGFLREHYTNSRESAAALANYLSKIPSGPEPKEARTPRGGKPATAAAPASSGPGGWFQTPAASEGKPTSNEARKPPAGQNAAGHTPPARASRAAAKPEEEPVAVPPATSAAHHPAVEPAESASKPDESAAKPEDAAAKPAESPVEPAARPAKPNPTARAQRGRQPAATAAAPMPPPPPEAAPAPPPPPPPPAPKDYDIFD